MVMVFTLVSAGQEWLNVRWDAIKKEREEQILAKKKAEEEAELVRSIYLLFQTYTSSTYLCTLVVNSTPG